MKFVGEAISETGDYRTSSTTWCDNEFCETNSTTMAVQERIRLMTGIPTENYEHFQLLQYFEGQEYKAHNDFIESDVNRAEGPRLLTVFMYLNDVEAGGGTHFPVVGKTVIPKQGRVVIWPSVQDADLNAEETRTEHAATPVEKGVKYAVNAWVSSSSRSICS